MINETNSFVTIENFGAIPDGITDCSEAFEFALRDNQNIILDEGVYYLDSTVILNNVTPKNIVIKGQGSNKTTLLINNNITAFEFTGYDITEPRDYDTIHFEGIKFQEKNNSHTSTAIYFSGTPVRYEQELSVEKCFFEGLDRGLYIANCGYIMFNRNTTSDCHVACDIGPNTMFTYLYDNVSTNDDYFIYCDIPFNGGISNGIYCNHNTVIGSKISMVKVGFNQSVYIDGCEFNNAFGDKMIDLIGCSDGSITNCKLTGNSETTCISIQLAENINIANNFIDTCNIGIQITDTPNRRDIDVILGNVINATIPIYVNYVNDIKVCDNIIANNIVEERAVNIVKVNNQPLTTERLEAERQKSIANTERNDLYTIYDTCNNNVYPVIQAGPYNLKDIIEGLNDNNTMTVIELTSDRTVINETINVNGHKNFIIKGKSSRQSTIETSYDLALFEGANSGEIYFFDVALCGSEQYHNICAVNIACDNQGSVNAYRVLGYNLGNLFNLSQVRSGRFLFIRNFLVQHALTIDSGTDIFADALLNSYQCGSTIDFGFVSNGMILNSCSCASNQREITLTCCDNILLKTCSADMGYDGDEALLILNSNDITIYDSWIASCNLAITRLPPAPNRYGINIEGSSNIIIKCNQLVNNKYGIVTSNSSNLTITENKGEGNLVCDYFIDNCVNSSLSFNSDVSYPLRGANPEFILRDCDNIICVYNTITHSENKSAMVDNCSNVEFNNLFDIGIISLNEVDLATNQV